jgi:hypothetical protein
MTGAASTGHLSPTTSRSSIDVTKEATAMKTMTCKQLGGPCDLELRGETADDVIHLQDQHLKDAVAAGDDAHRPANDDMRGRWKRPISGMKWYRQVQRDFAALPSAAGAA